ncbi:MAG: hypothetical protein ACOC1G_08015, partial [Phycisphaeraceae bacterium]
LDNEPAELVRKAESLDNSMSVASMNDAATLVAALRESTRVNLSDDQRNAITRALGDFAAAGGDAVLAWLLCVIPQGEELGLDRVWQLAQRSENPLVQCLLLERHVEDPEDPVLNQIIRNGSERMESYARAFRESLESAGDEADEQP